MRTYEPNWTKIWTDVVAASVERHGRQCSRRQFQAANHPKSSYTANDRSLTCVTPPQPPTQRFYSPRATCKFGDPWPRPEAQFPAIGSQLRQCLLPQPIQNKLAKHGHPRDAYVPTHRPTRPPAPASRVALRSTGSGPQHLEHFWFDGFSARSAVNSLIAYFLGLQFGVGARRRIRPEPRSPGQCERTSQPAASATRLRPCANTTTIVKQR